MERDCHEAYGAAGGMNEKIVMAIGTASPCRSAVPQAANSDSVLSVLFLII